MCAPPARAPPSRSSSLRSPSLDSGALAGVNLWTRPISAILLALYTKLRAVTCLTDVGTKGFAHDLFLQYRKLVEESIEQHRKQNRRNLYLCGVAKHSKVLQRYRIAMALEGLLCREYPAYVDLPRSLEEKSYAWAEWGRGDDESQEGEANKFVGGKLFLVKFGGMRGDPVWPVDVLISQARDPNEVNRILGYLLADALEGFPVPFYPQCLQQAHEKAALVGFDMEVLQEEVSDAVREQLGKYGPVLDEVRFRDADPARLRYGD